MTERIIILVGHDSPAQLRLATNLKQLFVENQVGGIEIQTTKTWLKQLEIDADPSAFNRAGFNIIFDLSADSSLRPAIDSTGCLHVILGGFLNGYLQPFGQASGIWEVAQRVPHTDFVIVSPLGAYGLTTWLHASIPTMRTWQQNQQQLIAACAEYTSLWWQKCQRSQRAERFAALVECRGITVARSSQWQRLSIIIRRTFDRVRSRLRRTFRQSQNWQVGWLESGQSATIDSCNLPNHESIWFADPYIWRDRQQRLWILCEHYDEDGDNLGRIALFEVNEDRQAVSHGIILAEHFHLSFPRLIEHGSKLYCTVESCKNKDVRLYESDSITEGWRLRRTLLQGEAFIDPMLFLHEDGYWYLFVSTTSVPSLKREVAPELRLFFSADLLNGEFCEHPQSPLMISSRAGRNGGMLMLENTYRVAQQTGYGGVYGESIAYFRIDELSPTTYRETPLQHPPAGLQLERLRSSLRATHLHTLNNHDRVLAFDFISS